MVEWSHLWWMIPLTAAIVFAASSAIWMTHVIHKNDYKKLGDKEEAARDLARAMPPGVYMFPWCTPKDEKTDPAAAERARAGPWGILYVVGKRWNMGPMLGLWFLNLLIAPATVAWVVRHSAPAATPPFEVFRVAAAASLLGYAG